MTYPNLYHLKYFMDAVELGSVTAAAQKNFVSHSAVSQAIKSIETQLGVRLLGHKKRMFEVTSDGQALAARTKSLLGALNNLGDRSTALENELSGKIVLGLSRSVAHIFLSPLLVLLRKQHPKLHLEIKFGTTSELLEKSAQDQVDCAITVGHQSMPTLRQTLVRQGQFVLIEPIVKRKMQSERFILTEPRFETELLKKNYYQHHKESLPILLEIGSWDSIAQLVAEGHGRGLVPDLSLTPERRKHIKKVSQNWFKCSYEIYLNEGKTFSKKKARNAVASIISQILLN